MDERVIGPVHGFYVTSFAARMGELGQQFLGYYRICDAEPQDFVRAHALRSGHCVDTSASAESALLQAEALALAQLQQMEPGPCHPTHREDRLAALMYVSTATHPGRLDVQALNDLLVRIRAWNNENYVSGVLLAFKGTFMQYIEGPPTQLELVYRRIQISPLHHGVIELLREQIFQREFTGWSMAFGSPEMIEHDPRRSLPSLFEGDSLPRTLLRGFLERGG